MQVQFADLPFYTGSMRSVVDRIFLWVRQNKRAYICVAGAHGIAEAHRRPHAFAALTSATLIVPDGMPLVWFIRRVLRRPTERMYGPDFMRAVCDIAAQKHTPIFLYGTTTKTLQRLARSLRGQYPGLLIAGTFAPPFRDLSRKEEQRVRGRIAASNAKIVFVGLSTPRQELWMARETGRLPPAVLLGVGAAFDFLSGTKPQAPRWMRESGLEWLYRLIQEPARLWRRYLVANAIFCFYAIRDSLRYAIHTKHD